MCSEDDPTCCHLFPPSHLDTRGLFPPCSHVSSSTLPLVFSHSICPLTGPTLPWKESGRTFLGIMEEPLNPRMEYPWKTKFSVACTVIAQLQCIFMFLDILCFPLFYQSPLLGRVKAGEKSRRRTEKILYSLL